MRKIVFLFLVVSVCWGEVAPKDLDLLKAACLEVSSKLPMKVDSETEALSCSVNKEGILYRFRYVNYVKDDLKDYMPNLRAIQTHVVMVKVCSLPNAAGFRGMGAKVKYQYLDREDVLLYDVVVDMAECYRLMNPDFASNEHM